MAEVKEGFIPSLPRRAWSLCKAALAWIWIAGRIAKWYREEGAKQERVELIEVFARTIAGLETNNTHAGKVRHLRFARAIIVTRHNRIENLRRDGPGDDRLIGEIDPHEFERVAKEGGSLQFKRVPWYRRGWGGAK